LYWLNHLGGLNTRYTVIGFIAFGVQFALRAFNAFGVQGDRSWLPSRYTVESDPKSRVFEIVGTVAKYYFDGMPSVQLFKRSIVQLIVHN